MDSRLINFYDAETSFFSDTHTLVRGGKNMAIKHTHPEYENSKQREEALKSAKQACLNAVSALRETAHKRSA